ncbi:hypothetical protein J2X54_000453 [Duganella sp. 3397]|uniref:plasmid recombination protein n=1 Tax=Duganella sp. 3397 TaxID=2817732 RepID=UPI0028630734|nr:plasmid recombination protein [Duganella sp. 3397]MDR7048018.1 hypothetical protein [Duganella sp. 3397]
MTDSLYLRLKSLNTRTVRGVTSPKNIVRVAAMHNLREIQAELGTSATSGINPARMHLNYQLRGPATADEVAGLALALLDNAGVTTLRRDACMALELVVSLPADTAINHREYFAAAVTWADAYFNVPILSAAVHLDEAAPHLHILLLPLVAGRMQGGALAGGPAKIRAMLADFQQQVAQRFGLTHQPRAKRLSKPRRDAAGRMVLDALRARPEHLCEPGLRDALIAALGSQADTLLALMGLTMPTAKEKAKSFAAIMTAPCKPERAHRAAPNTKHIDIAQNLGNQGSENSTTSMLCIDVAPSPSSNPTTEQPQQPATASTADQQASRTDFVRLVEQCEPGANADHQQADRGMQKVLDTLPAPAGGPGALLHPKERNAPSRQPPSSATLLPCASVQTVSLAQAGAGKIPDTPAGAQHQAGAGAPNADEILARKDASIRGVIPAGAPKFGPTPAGADARKPAHISLLNAEGEQPGHVPAQPEIPENPETGGISLPTPTPASGGSPRSAWPSQPPMVGREFKRQRDGDHLAASWCSDRGEFVPATGPPCGAQQHHQQPARRYRVHETRKATS